MLNKTISIAISAIIMPVFLVGVAFSQALERQGIEEIIVTAQKTEQNIQDVPIAVTAFNTESLELQQIETFSDLQFNDLEHDSVKTIVNIQINRLSKRMADQGIKVKIEDDVKLYLVNNGYDPEYGARPVQRLIRREILAGLSRYLLEFPHINQVTISMQGNNVQFYSAKLKQEAA